MGDNGPAHDHSSVVTADGSINISQSKVKLFRQCRKAYYYKFVMMLQRKLIKRPFMFGGIVHEIIEANLEGKNWQKVLEKIELDNKRLFRKEIDMYGRIVEDIRYIMIDYFEYWGDEFKAFKHDGRRSEWEFRIELDDGIWFTGRIDTAGKAKKMKWLGEHKTFNRMPSEDERWRSVQSSVYFKALKEMGFPDVDGVMWDYISSKPLNVPGELTPTGKLSQRAIDSTPSRIAAWLKEQGHKKKDYPKLIADAKANLSSRFIRVYTPVKKAVVKSIWNDFVDTARDIAEYHNGRMRMDMNVGRHCQWCDFRDLCKAHMLGADVDWIIKRDFTTEGQRSLDGESRDEG